jgi:hypothetical protein
MRRYRNVDPCGHSVHERNFSDTPLSVYHEQVDDGRSALEGRFDNEDSTAIVARWRDDDAR